MGKPFKGKRASAETKACHSIGHASLLSNLSRNCLVFRKFLSLGMEGILGCLAKMKGLLSCNYALHETLGMGAKAGNWKDS
jgi:hypothetical protein